MRVWGRVGGGGPCWQRSVGGPRFTIWNIQWKGGWEEDTRERELGGCPGASC